MAPSERVFTDKAPAPLPQFSQAVKFNGMVYCSGNLGVDPVTGVLVEGGVKEQARRALQNIEAVLSAADSGLDCIVKVNVFLSTMRDFTAFNEAWDEFFTHDVKPCRTCVAVYQLPRNGLVEIECTAFLRSAAKL